jgi:type IV secretion system protein VirD4
VARWWLDTRGVFAGVILPALFAVLAGVLDVRTIPLGLAVGLALGLVWRAGRVGKVLVYGAIGLALLPVAAVVLLGVGVVLVIVALLFPSVLLLGLALVLVRAFARRPEPHYHAHLAVEEETQDMVMGDEEGTTPWGEGVMLGVHYGRVLGVAPGFEGRREMGHFLVTGPSRSGKGLHLVANLLMWQGSAIALDVKGELYGLTSAARRGLGNDVLVLDPSGRGHRYDPFAELSYSPEALKRAVELIMEPDRGRDPIFAQRGAAALYAAAMGARIEGVPTLPYVRELTAEGPTRFVEHLAGLGDPRVRKALVDFLGARPEELGRRDFREDRFLSSTWSTMTARLGPVLAEGVLKMTGGSDFMAADLVRRPTTLYLMFHESELEYTKKVFQVVMLSLVTGLIRHGDLEADQGGVPMLVALDEAGRTPIPKLDEMVSTISGRGMSALVYVQDLGQLESAYGRAGAQTIRSNCHTQIYYRPTDYATASHISRMCGKTSVEDVRAGSGGNHSMGFRERELLTPDELMREMDPTNVIAFAGKKPPIPAHRLEWFNLIPGASEFVANNPLPEPPELPIPEVVIPDGGGAAAPDLTSTGVTGRRRTDDPPSAAYPQDGGRGGVDGDGGPRWGGYVEPDV